MAIGLEHKLVPELLRKSFYLLVYLELLVISRFIVHVVEIFRDLFFELSIDLFLVHKLVDTVLLLAKITDQKYLKLIWS